MNTKPVMTASAALLALIGITLTFMPRETIGWLHINRSNESELLVQLTGALYFAFGILNWMAKGSIIGGIYSRPLSMANFAHFMIGGLALAKGVMQNPELPYATWVMAGIYLLFAVLFGMILFRHPKARS